MHAFIEMMTDWLDDVQKMDSQTLALLMKMGSQVQKLLKMKDRVKQVFAPAGRPAALPATAIAAPPPANPAGSADNNHKEESMDTWDPFVLARIQFAANITFHILFPTITIALGWALLFFKTRFVATGKDHWMAAYQFWVKIFALTFALGAVSGVTMSFQSGTNWPGFMNTVGNVAGPLLAYEVLTAFSWKRRCWASCCSDAVGSASGRTRSPPAW
jgi:hypothetical protein